MIEKLKSLEEAATPRPWSQEYANNDWRLMAALRDLAPEIIEVLEAVEHWHKGGEMMSISEPFGRLANKAKEVLG